MASIEMICRGCMSTTSHLQQLFDENNLGQIFQLSTGLVLSIDDGFSSSVCSSCVAILNVYNSFRLRCIETDEILRHRHQDLVKTFEDGFSAKDSPHMEVINENAFSTSDNIVSESKFKPISTNESGTKTYAPENAEKSLLRRNAMGLLSESDEGDFDKAVERNISPPAKMDMKTTTDNEQPNKSEKLSKKLSKEYDPYETLFIN